MTFEHPILASKAQTLENLRPHLRSARLLPQVTVPLHAWRGAPEGILDRIAETLGAERPMIVRSSAQSEDSATASLAGAFLSVPDVLGRIAQGAAIEAVFASYAPAPSEGDAVLIQPMLRDVVCSGVAFSHDQSTGAPYRAISIHRGADTTAVTAGNAPSETHVVAPGTRPNDPAAGMVCDLLDELRGLIPNQPLDIEFAVCGHDAPYCVLLQARPLILPNGPVRTGEDGRFAAALDRVAARVEELQRPHPYLSGATTVFGVMPDWNPAEIIGTRPRPLALSLYRYLITDQTWAYQRSNYGYRNLRGFPLLQSFAGQPFVDVRLSFNSFLPADLPEDIANRLVDYYVDRLVEAPTLHDKIEFEIVFSCYTLDLPERIEVLADHGFSDKDRRAIVKSLRNLTNRVIERKNGLWKLDARKIEELKTRRETIQQSGLGHLDRVRWLMEDCRRYGTLPFAGLARAGFMAIQMLRSLITTGVLTEAEMERFLASIDTVTRRFGQDLGTMDRTTFLDRYGHLRPGTYDIRSPRYDEAPDLYLSDRTAPDAPVEPDAPFGLSLKQMREIRTLLDKHKLSTDVVELIEFVHAGIEMREYAKFVFTRSLSDALVLLGDWGAQHGFSVDDMSFADIHDVIELSTGSTDPVEAIGASIARGRAADELTQSVWLPPLIVGPKDVYGFTLADAAPNYITSGEAIGQVVVLDTMSDGTARDDLAGKIVFIPAADPGYDWLFSRGIAGLVTLFGGVNSHMAIRAAELRLPAVIGAGETLYARWAKAARLRLDCGAQMVERLS
ncbi:MAG: PEP/pyruvate-binding domain-containing protein [Shimia sp.]